jgi:FkbM family methyltransferase
VGVIGTVVRRLAHQALTSERLRRQLHWWGFSLEPIVSPKLAPFDVRLKSALDQYHVDFVVDVGANRGQFGQRLRKLGYAGQIVSFEPVRACHDLLNQTATRLPPWSAHCIGLGDAAGEVSINVSSHNNFSSFLASNTFGRKTFAAEINSVSSEKVRVARLDDVLLELGYATKDRRVFLKLDTQGYDLKVMAGARDVLKDVHVLLSEVSIVPIYDGMPGYLEALSTYASLGFTPSDFDRVTADAALRAIEFDCLLVRSSASTG